MLLKAEADVTAQKISNDELYTEVSLLRDKAQEDLKSAHAMLNEANAKIKEVADQKDMINAHFSHIEVDQKELEERRRSLDEREELIKLKGLEVDAKLSTLQQLRARST
jgi:chromosome segregation ATPase